MRNLAIIGLAILLSALNGMAIAPIQLGGISGHAILTGIASTNITYQPTNASPIDLWKWGKVPMGYLFNESAGRLVESASDEDEDNAWLSARSEQMEGLNTSEYD